jgi:hypothetical protein
MHEHECIGKMEKFVKTCRIYVSYMFSECIKLMSLVCSETFFLSHECVCVLYITLVISKLEHALCCLEFYYVY